MNRMRILLSAAALAAATVLAAGLSGCAQSPSTPASDAPAPTSTSGSAPDIDDVEVAWLDDGRSFAVVTWGSSSCVPQTESISAAGQEITVTLVDPDEGVCTSDLAPRASLAVIPEGVDVTKDIDVTVVNGDFTGDTELDALPAAPEGPTDMQPSAGWFDDDGIVLLTWGSSTCPPVVSGVEETDGGATVTFADDDRVCTMDMGPRVTVIGVQEPADDDAPFTLTLEGGGLSGTVEVMD
ncbi:hypothetical protein DY023_03645 [Microbacterium bovistercoris]|uniref:Lipoprotein n=1 Tax=Microbacterium bovistercoris TaxID=2293570 RepID=A0A371NWJ3_9MICO|nr:hypothetical protein [Microbacterium bovistercoris]REJ07472.1 hypothetical protein DY023_03645 [Microbacterium bovistercoris]